MILSSIFEEKKICSKRAKSLITVPKSNNKTLLQWNKVFFLNLANVSYKVNTLVPESFSGTGHFLCI